MSEIYLIIEIKSPKNIFTLTDQKGNLSRNTSWVQDVWSMMKNSEVITNGLKLKVIKYW